MSLKLFEWADGKVTVDLQYEQIFFYWQTTRLKKVDHVDIVVIQRN